MRRLRSTDGGGDEMQTSGIVVVSSRSIPVVDTGLALVSLRSKSKKSAWMDTLPQEASQPKDGGTPHYDMAKDGARNGERIANLRCTQHCWGVDDELLSQNTGLPSFKRDTV